MHEPTNTKQFPSSIENNRLTMLQQEEQMTYKAFELQNFYQNNKLNLLSLKDRIQKFKKSKQNSKSPINLSMNHLGENHPISKHEDNSYNSTHNESNNKQTIPSSHIKLQKIIVPPSQQQKRQLISQKLNHFSIQLKQNNQTNNPRNRVTSQMINDLRNNNTHHDKFIKNQHQNVSDYQKPQSDYFKIDKDPYKKQINFPRRQNVIKSHFDKYQTVSNHDPQFINNQKQLSIKRQKTQQNLKKLKDMNNNTRYNQMGKIPSNTNNNLNHKFPPRPKQFKIQPISAIPKRQDRHSHKPRPNINNKSTQKSFIGSQSRVSLQINSLNKTIHIGSQYQLDKLQALISRLWRLYEALINIMQHAGDEPFGQQDEVNRYVQQVCGEGYEQVVSVLETVNCKRLSRAVKLGKILENLSVVYLFLELVKKKKADKTQNKTHIVNFIGYCTSNVIFLIKVLYLVHDLELINRSTGVQLDMLEYMYEEKKGQKQELQYQNQVRQSIRAQIQNISSTPSNKLQSATYNPKQLVTLNNQSSNYSSQKTPPNKASPFSYSTHTQSILNTIRKFQLQSYKQELKSLLDIILRMEHNNEIINIVQVKFCSQNDKYFQSIVSDFLKRSLRDQSETLFSYARYIFEFLAFHIAKFKIYGCMASLQVAPQPYLSLKFPHTIIIEPYEVLVFQNKLNILIRAYAQKFVQALSNRCNIVFWTDQMPQDIDPILNIFPKKDNVYTLYKYHCIYNDRLQTFVKPLNRLGGEIDNMIIIDRSMANFIHHKYHGIQSRWMGEKKDIKLKGLLSILESLLAKQETLKKSLSQARKQLNQLSAKLKKNLINRNKFKRIDNEFQSDSHEEQLLALTFHQQSKVLKDPQIRNGADFLQEQHCQNNLESQMKPQNQIPVKFGDREVNQNKQQTQNEDNVSECQQENCKTLDLKEEKQQQLS